MFNMPETPNKSLVDIATDPEQYTQGEASSWMADSKRQKEQRDRFWSAIAPIIPLSCHNVLDIGCGSGWVAERLSKINIKQYVGIEPSLKNFEIAKREHPELAVLRITLEEYVPDTTFDCAIAILSVSHMKDIRASFKKVFDLLKRKGVFMFVLSAFHEDPERHERNNRRYEIDVIDKDQYADRSIEGTSYGIADINRRPEYYIKAARSLGFNLIKQAKIEDAGYSPKDLLVFEKP